MSPAVFGSMMGIFLNQGQVCCAGSRVSVQQQMYDQFTDQLAQFAQGMTVGSPLDPNSRIEPPVSKEQFERVTNYLEIGKKSGHQG